MKKRCLLFFVDKYCIKAKLTKNFNKKERNEFIPHVYKLILFINIDLLSLHMPLIL